MVENQDKFEKLIFRRDSLLNQNLNKQVRLAKENLRREIKEQTKKNKVKKRVVSKKEKKKINFPSMPNIHISVPKIEISEDKIKNEEIKKLVPKKELPDKKLAKTKILKKEKKHWFRKFKMKKELESDKKIEPKKIDVIPNKKLLEKEMDIDLAISRDNQREEERQKELKRKERSSSEESIQNEIKERSKEKTSKISNEVKEINRTILALKKEVAKVVVGQDEVIDAFICALLCDGHVLLEGVPGIAKTLIVKTLAQASGCSSNRIQFTVDLLPSDIVGITTYTPQKGFETIKGPVFSNFIVADEINRSPPKTQSAMIEAMQEKQVTIGKETFKLPVPFFVMANNNPLEVSGVYTLPEAQIDRFLFKLVIEYPKHDEEKIIMEDNTTLKKFETFGIKPILSPGKIIQMQKLTKEIYVDDRIKDYILKIVEKTRKKDFENG